MSKRTPARRYAFLALLTLSIFLSGCLNHKNAKDDGALSGDSEQGEPNDLLHLGEPWLLGETEGSWGAIVEFDGEQKAPTECGLSYDVQGTSPIARNVLAVVIEDSKGVGRLYTDGPGSSLDSANVGISSQNTSKETGYGEPLGWNLNRTLPVKFQSGEPIHFIAVVLRDLDDIGDKDASKINVECVGTTPGARAVQAHTQDWFDISGNSDGTGAWADFTTGRSGVGIEQAYRNSTTDSAFLGISVEGDLLTLQGSAGQITVTHPNGTDEWIVRPGQTIASEQTDPWHSYHFGPGTYTATFDFANVYPTSSVVGLWLTWPHSEGADPSGA